MEQHPREGVRASAVPRGPRRAANTLAVAALVVAGALSGCASGGGASVIDRTMQAVGLQDRAPAPNDIALRLHAGDNLNAGTDSRALSLVVRVYQLRDRERFEQAPFDVFLDAQRERDVLGNDMIAVTEFLLSPGQRHEVLEQLPADGRHLGVVALFRSPAPTRWRFSFDAPAAAKGGVTVGLHACAMTTTSAALETQLAGPAHSLSGSRCTSTPG